MINDRDELKQEAERLGLTNLTDEQLAQFAEAKASAELLAGGIDRAYEKATDWTSNHPDLDD